MSTQGTNEREGDEGDTSAKENNRKQSLLHYGCQQLGENHLPTSNLPPPQHRLESSSRIQLQLQPYPHPQNEAGLPQYWTDWHPPPHHQNTALGRTQEIQFRGLVGPAAGTNSFYPAPPFSYQIPNTHHQHQQVGYVGIHPNYQREMEESSSRNVRMRMTLQDGRLGSTCFNPAPDHQPNHIPNPPRRMRNSVYDPVYEEMGLPVDPHLRMFLAKRNQGKD